MLSIGKGAIRSLLMVNRNTELFSHRIDKTFTDLLKTSEQPAAGARNFLKKESLAPFVTPLKRSLVSNIFPEYTDRTKRKAHLLSPLVGSFAGAFGSVVGVGGGTLIVPVMSNICASIPQRVISGTSLVAVITTGLATTSVYASNQCIDFYSVALIASSAIVSAPLGAMATTVIKNSVLKKILGCFLILAAAIVPFKSFYLNTKDNNDIANDLQTQMNWKDTFEFKWPERNLAIMLSATGLCAGFASGLLGIGGGTLVTPILALVTDMPQTHILGTSLCAMIFPSIVGLVQHYRMRNVDWVMALGLALGTSIGGLSGSYLAINTSQEMLQVAFAMGMFSLGLRMLKK